MLQKLVGKLNIMMTDTIADMLTRIRNGQMRQKESVEMPYSKHNENIAKVLAEKGLVKEVKTFKYEGKSYKGLSIKLNYDAEGNPSIHKIERVSKPGLRKYFSANEIKPVLGGMGFYIISTSKGVMASTDARKKRLGGEIICRVY